MWKEKPLQSLLFIVIHHSGIAKKDRRGTRDAKESARMSRAVNQRNGQPAEETAK